ncbi:MAG TPA: hypothetical protein VG652_02155 [Gaiellaceae bacterium]|nr:hypothetical protein [Gaiellaceae bacterium]
MHRRRSFLVASAVPAAVLALLSAGCGGNSPAAGVSTTSSTSSTTTNGPLAFARCMRAHGLSKWPDPTSSGVFDKATLRQTGYSESQVRAVEDGACAQLLGGASPQRPTITAADRADYLAAAACMRTHGFAGFPDPTFLNGGVQTNVPATIDQDSSRFKAAATTCTKLIPAGLPYSRPSGSG